MQQVDEGLFPTIGDVPTHALTLTVPALTRAGVMVATVLGTHKARAVVDALTGPESPACPASVLRSHPQASMHLDHGAAALLGPGGDELSDGRAVPSSA
jgi:glucosamine-6-phosphate deaminase